MVDNDIDKKKQQEELRLFKCYIRELDECKKDLEKIEKINEPEEKHKKTSILLGKYCYKRAGAISYYNNGKLYELGISFADELHEHDRSIEKLKKIKVAIQEKKIEEKP